jgi:hypothetical protein
MSKGTGSTGLGNFDPKYRELLKEEYDKAVADKLKLKKPESKSTSNQEQLKENFRKLIFKK